MTNPWFRFYPEVLNNPKVQTLDSETFKIWVNLLCICSNGKGTLPELTIIAFHLRLPLEACSTHLSRLCEADLVGKVNATTYKIPSWEKRQYKSDVSTERTRRCKERSRSVPGTPPEYRIQKQIQIQKSKDIPLPLKQSKMFELPDWLPSKQWKGYLEMRRAQGKPATSDAMEMAFRKLLKFKDAGCDIEKIIEQSIFKGWLDFFELKDGGNYGKRNNGKTDAERLAEVLANS